MADPSTLHPADSDMASASRIARCSPAQERYFAIDRADPGTPALNIIVKWLIRGHLDTSLAQQAFQAVLQRHEALRTAIVAIDGRPMQRIFETTPFKLAEIDLTGRPATDRRKEADRIAGLDAQERFDITIAPLLRAMLLRLSRSEAILVVTVHHAAGDGWSMGLIARDFVAFYQSISRGEAIESRAAGPDYAGIAEAQCEALARGDLAVEETYWRDRLDGLPFVEIPPDRPRPAERSANGASLSRLLPRELTRGLGELARSADTTFFVAACALVIALLRQRSGADDLALSTQMASRDEVEQEGIVGPFVNTIVLRTAIAEGHSFRDVVATMRDAFEEAVEHHLLPYCRMLPPEVTTASRPPVSVNVIVQRAFIGERANDSFHLSGIPSPLPGALYDLNFILVEREEGWRLTCEYHTDLYDEATAQGLVAEFQALAERFLEAPDAPLPGITPVTRPAASAAPLPEITIDPAWIRQSWLQRGGTQPPLFALNHTAQNQSLYRPLSRELGPDQPFAALQLLEPGIDGRPPASLVALAAAYREAILSIDPGGRYRIIGFCRSGVLAFEVARQLAAKGHQVDLLALIDCWAPGYFMQQPYLARLIFRLKRMLRVARRYWQGGPRSFLMRMGFWLQASALGRKLKRLHLWQDRHEAMDDAEFWQATDLLEHLVQDYEIGAYRGRAILFRSEGIPAGWPPDPALGWGAHLPTGSPCFQVPGHGHEGAFTGGGPKVMESHIRALLSPSETG